ncbi:hypothetical protein E1B28_011899 [Marasmius oreades]|uniref:Uncharacterized protein n=1 Tax=Marasmius oreades TaxID=181124 RepID=A0A9P7URP1_9AGAR|nr:uncharacterized protein E1B28_011899 [Marasmius oreades]KAG7090301.1 hypothetical protein E1B28_011899 [Marasmius oreades]
MNNGSPQLRLDVAIFSFESHRSTVASKLSMHVCLLHCIFKASAGIVIFSLFHAILTLRVYALYDRSRRLAFLFGSVGVSRLAVAIQGLVSKIIHGRSVDHNWIHVWFDQRCLPRRSFPGDPAIAFFVLIEISTQFMLCYLTLRKTLLLKRGCSSRYSGWDCDG